MVALPFRIALLTSLVGCTDPDAQQQPLPRHARRVPSTPVAIDLVAVYASGMEEPARLVITDEATWASVWNTIHEAIQPRPAAPVIDFVTSMVVVAAMGSRPTGGFAVSIEGVYQTDEQLYVVIKEISPGSGCATTQATTAPVAAVKVDRLTLPITYLERRETTTCG